MSVCKKWSIGSSITIAAYQPSLFTCTKVFSSILPHLFSQLLYIHSTLFSCTKAFNSILSHLFSQLQHVHSSLFSHAIYQHLTFFILCLCELSSPCQLTISQMSHVKNSVSSAKKLKTAVKKVVTRCDHNYLLSYLMMLISLKKFNKNRVNF